MLKTSSIAAIIALAATPAFAGGKAITLEEVNKAQSAWCDALVKIGNLKENNGNYREFAEQVLSGAPTTTIRVKCFSSQP